MESPDQPLELPRTVGVMALPGMTLFPGSLLPLFIFEPRFRLMLTRALESHRFFAIANMHEDLETPLAVGGLGLVRACVQNPDGTSHLVLQGVSRVRFENWPQRTPYFIGEISVISSRPAPDALAQSLMEEIRTLCRQLQVDGSALPERLDACLREIRDPQVFSDLLAATLIGEPETRQCLLEETDSLTRLETISRSLTSMME